MFFRKIVFLFCMVPAFFFFNANAGGVAIGATRVIYRGENKEASMTVQNKDAKEEYLIQTWVEDSHGGKKTPFIVTPPLFRLDPKADNILRIVNINNDFPQDRESVYWLNIKAIPSASEDKASSNVLQIAVRTRLKMFYRPKGLPGTPADAQSTLTFKQEGQSVVVSNPSAYNLPFYDVSIDKHDVPNAGMVAAKGQLSIPLPSDTGQVHQVVYKIINDFGSASETYTRILK